MLVDKHFDQGCSTNLSVFERFVLRDAAQGGNEIRQGHEVRQCQAGQEQTGQVVHAIFFLNVNVILCMSLVVALKSNPKRST